MTRVSMYPDQVMDAIHFAEFVMAKEKADRAGGSQACVYPMKFLFFYNQQAVTGLMGTPFNHPGLDDKDALSMVVRMFVKALEAKAVFHVTEAWIATRCAHCGDSILGTPDAPCQACGREVAPPSKDPHREEILICKLRISLSESRGWQRL